MGHWGKMQGNRGKWREIVHRLNMVCRELLSLLMGGCHHGLLPFFLTCFALHWTMTMRTPVRMFITSPSSSSGTKKSGYLQAGSPSR